MATDSFWSGRDFPRSLRRAAGGSREARQLYPGIIRSINMKDSNPAESGFFNALMDAAVDAIIIIDQQAIIRRFNQTAQNLFGYSEDEVLGRNVNLLMPESIRAHHDGYLKSYLETGKAAIIGQGREETGVKKSGEKFPMRLSVGESRIGDTVHFVGIIHDLSRFHETEEKLRFLEQQLIHADRLLTLGELTAGIAHEINQPLTAIAAYADAARHMVEQAPDSVDPDVHNICARISQQSRRAAAVVDRLRNLSRSGPSNKASHNVRNIIKSTLLLFDYEIKKTGISLETDIADNLPEVFVDEIQIQQILVNLVKNSLDAIQETLREDGKIKIKIQQQENLMSISVQDNGAGVSDDNGPHLFEPFFTSKPKGVGLGLSICTHIAIAHGGSLTHSHPESGGARFSLNLPLSVIG
jgi:two-component system sensor kinase FixL